MVDALSPTAATTTAVGEAAPLTNGNGNANNGLRRVDRGVEPSSTSTSRGSDSVRAYLREIGRYDLLTPAQELSLAALIRTGEEAKHRLPSLLTDGGAAAQIERARAEAAAGQRAREMMTQANLRLVVAIARRYQNSRVPLLDLIQEGNVGLMRAVEGFDHTRGFRFSTYATWWIRQAIMRALGEHGRIVRVPGHVNDMVQRIARRRWQLLQEDGVEPSMETVAADVGVPVERVREYVRLANDALSLDERVSGSGDDSTVGDFVADTTLEVPADAVAAESLRDVMRIGIACLLTEREQEVIRLRYGFDDDHPRTLEEVGRELGVTRERIRQIEIKALEALGQLVEVMQLDAYLAE